MIRGKALRGLPDPPTGDEDETAELTKAGQDLRRRVSTQRRIPAEHRQIMLRDIDKTLQSFRVGKDTPAQFRWNYEEVLAATRPVLQHYNVTSVAIVGGGPVGMATALCILEYSRRRLTPIQVHIFEKRWKKDDATGQMVWKGVGDNNNRRWQVVTVQSNVWSLLPGHVKKLLFTDDDKYLEMWPNGPDSPVEFPRNIPVRVLEDKLLQILQEEGARCSPTKATDGSPLELQQPEPILHAAPFTKEDYRRYQQQQNGEGNTGDSAESSGDESSDNSTPKFDFVVLADGGAMQTEKNVFPGAFGERVPFPEDPELEVMEDVLGIYIESPGGTNQEAIGVSESEGMAITVSQNRFLLNPLGRRMGFLNMWLTPEEAKEAVGLVLGDGNKNDIKKVLCTQRSPCRFMRDPGGKGNFRCPTHGTHFLPQVTHNVAGLSKLWPRIVDGLKMYGIPLDCVKAFTSFRLGPYSQRTNFCANLNEYFHDPSIKTKSSPYAFVIGDAAFTVSFRAGRGLNTGLKAGVSMARTIVKAAEKGSWRASDFTPHTGFMMALQEREVRIRTLKMMKVQGSSGKFEMIAVDKFNRGIASDGNAAEQTLAKKTYMDRLLTTARRTFPADRLAAGISAPDLGVLTAKVESASSELLCILSAGGPWNSADVGGLEVSPDDSAKEPMWTNNTSEMVLLSDDDELRVRAGLAATVKSEPAVQSSIRKSVTSNVATAAHTVALSDLIEANILGQEETTQPAQQTSGKMTGPKEQEWSPQLGNHKTTGPKSTRKSKYSEVKSQPVLASYVARTLRNDIRGGALPFMGDRQAPHGVQFRILNNTGETLTFEKVKMTTGTVVAYPEIICPQKTGHGALQSSKSWQGINSMPVRIGTDVDRIGATGKLVYKLGKKGYIIIKMKNAQYGRKESGIHFVTELNKKVLVPTATQARELTTSADDGSGVLRLRSFISGENQAVAGFVIEYSSFLSIYVPSAAGKK